MMRYVAGMGLIFPVAAALIATAAPAAGQAWSATVGGSPSPATRFDGSATVTVSARIVSASAAVGPGRAPPAPRMVPRDATVTAADGRAVAALIYDFE